ncbi:MAG: HNH endonuclease [Deltaproteobacteria bacterium]|nr:HNH endonuclease [Candidatus Anaeroferrophillacea bacterium]
MNYWIDIAADEKHIAREKQRARELRRGAWWRARIDAGRCHYCGRRVPPEALTMDHVVPLARGGRSVKGNVVPCCKECNNRKKFLTPVEIALESLRSPDVPATSPADDNSHHDHD